MKMEDAKRLNIDLLRERNDDELETAEEKKDREHLYSEMVHPYSDDGVAMVELHVDLLTQATRKSITTKIKGYKYIHTSLPAHPPALQPSFLPSLSLH